MNERITHSLALCLAAICACGGESRRESSPPDTGVVATSPTHAASEPNYVGLQYDSLPRDFKYHGGAVIPAMPDRPSAQYDFAYVTTPRGDMVWLDTIGAAGRGLPARIVRAEVTVPPLAADERLMMGSCDVNGHLDPRVVAVVINDTSATRFTQVRQAWRVDPTSGRFVIIPIRGITCEEPG